MHTQDYAHTSANVCSTCVSKQQRRQLSPLLHAGHDSDIYGVCMLRGPGLQVVLHMAIYNRETTRKINIHFLLYHLSQPCIYVNQPLLCACLLAVSMFIVILKETKTLYIALITCSC